MEIDIKNKEKIGKLITIILIGILLLVISMPVKKSTDDTVTAKDETVDYSSCADYYEKKLKTILEHSYGEGSMEIMVHVTDGEQTGSLYTSDSGQAVVDGVLVVADVDDEQAVADITFAVCALFDLPAHKVAVMIKN